MRILVLGGTSEARILIARISKHFDVTASLAGVTRSPLELGCETRIGGFGGVEGLKAYLREMQVDVVVDATHPFAAKMTRQAAEATRETRTGYVILQRPQWEPALGDDWRYVAECEDVARIIPENTTVFLGTGRQTLERFAGLAGRRVLCRVIDPPERDFPFEGGRFIVGRPPFSIEQEVAFFESESVEWLVVKNAGGKQSRSKLDAARQLGLPVVMQRRPDIPVADLVESVEGCVNWLAAL